MSVKPAKYLTLEQNSATMREVLGRWDWELKQFAKPPMTFDEACEVFPHLVSETTDRMPFPSWGHGHYIAGDDGKPKCIAGNWDTSG